MTTPIGRRIAVNPIPYWSKAGKTKEVFEEAFADFAKIGYNAVKGTRQAVPAIKEWWKVIAVVALGVLLFEWYIYNRRVYV